MVRIVGNKKAGSASGTNKKTTSSSSSTKSKSKGKAKSSTGTKTAYQEFMSQTMAELKDQHPSWSGEKRRAEMSRLWKMDPSNPKRET
ncbi:hypothetical protein BMF94_3256 [Rhodotorula taiwanensis]|uniref:Coiled-coil domain-containing protein n=1 Tax=Rhodotorula taiwanensis TaxID=741276 RepID=A0A2S5BAC4_9BASI|nr:hypothetical protein BMF94_3256 [Rhodotorula taiwanensis]